MTTNKTHLPACLRLNNPMCLTASAKFKWLGQVGETATGKCIFTSVEAGIRAGVLNLNAYHQTHGIEYLIDYIRRWADPAHNPTGNYVRFVSTLTGLDLFDKVKWPDDIGNMVDAMIRFELGGNWLEREVVVRGVFYGLHRDNVLPHQGHDYRD